MQNYRTLRNFLSVIDIIKPFYLLCIFAFLTVYVIFSWIGRFNEKLKYRIFSNGDVNSSFHLWRYTIIPTVIFVMYLYVIITKSMLEKTNWLDYGRTKSLILFVIFIIMFISACVTIEMRKKHIFFGNNLKVFKNWIPLIIILLLMTVTFIFVWNILG